MTNFYISLKVLKPINPRRTVINSNECHTLKVLRLVDHDLQPVLENSFSCKRYKSSHQ